MAQESKVIAEIKTAQSADASALAHDADSIARSAQMEAVMEKVIKKQFAAEDDEIRGEKRFINIGRIPLICQDISNIKSDIKDINDNLRWGVRIVVGGVMLGLLALIIPHFTSVIK